MSGGFRGLLVASVVLFPALVFAKPAKPYLYCMYTAEEEIPMAGVVFRCGSRNPFQPENGVPDDLVLEQKSYNPRLAFGSGSIRGGWLANDGHACDEASGRGTALFKVLLYHESSRTSLDPVTLKLTQPQGAFKKEIREQDALVSPSHFSTGWLGEDRPEAPKAEAPAAIWASVRFRRLAQRDAAEAVLSGSWADSRNGAPGVVTKEAFVVPLNESFHVKLPIRHPFQDTIDREPLSGSLTTWIAVDCELR